MPQWLGEICYERDRPREYEQLLTRLKINKAFTLPFKTTILKRGIIQFDKQADMLREFALKSSKSVREREREVGLLEIRTLYKTMSRPHPRSS